MLRPYHAGRIMPLPYHAGRIMPLPYGRGCVMLFPYAHGYILCTAPGGIRAAPQEAERRLLPRRRGGGLELLDLRGAPGGAAAVAAVDGARGAALAPCGPQADEPR